jgi:hypothetical protein
MTLEEILKNFYFEKVNENKYPKFDKAGRQDFIFLCKHCNSQSEPMKFEPDIKYRLASHLVNHCNPSSSATAESKQQQEEVRSTDRSE